MSRSFPLTFERLKKRALASARGETYDEDAMIMWQAITVIAQYAHDYDHLSPKEVFDFISTGTRPWSKGPVDVK